MNRFHSFALAAMLPAVAMAQGAPLLVDTAEIYCTDAARAGFQSMGVTYNRTMPNHFSKDGLKFCRLDMVALSGPKGNAEAGWQHNEMTGITGLWCIARSAPGLDADVRMRFALFGHPAGGEGAGCLSARAGRMP